VDFTATDVREEDGYVRVTGRLDDRWEVVARVAGEPPRLVGLSVHRVGGGDEALTSEVLRAVPLTEVMAAARQFTTGVEQAVVVLPSAGRGYDDVDYAWWALRYVRLVNAGSRRPVADLAADVGMKASRVRDLIHTCREKGMLPKSRPGLPGGTLTAKARRLLGMNED
jgi:hypothetical protein